MPNLTQTQIKQVVLALGYAQDCIELAESILITGAADNGHIRLCDQALAPLKFALDKANRLTPTTLTE